MNSLGREITWGGPAGVGRRGVLCICLPDGRLPDELSAPGEGPPRSGEDNARGGILGGVTRTGQGGIRDRSACADAGVYPTIGFRTRRQALPKPVNHPPSTNPPLVIGLLGGIAAGKSTVARIFAEHGFRVLDADLVARDVVADPACQARIRDRFGPEVFADDGTLDREALAELIFADPPARLDLEAIIHPQVRAIMVRDLAAARAEGVPVVLDVPLLLERGLIDECDLTVFLATELAIRQERARERGWSDDALQQRETSQADLAAKQARCRFTLRTDGPMADTRREIADLLRTLDGFEGAGCPPDQPNS